MTPATLDHADLRIGEKVDGALKQFWRRNEISVENADELTTGRFESNRERACLEAGPVDPMNELNIEAALTQFLSAGSGHVPRVISRIIQDLDLQQFARVIEFADRTQKALNHVNFIKNRKLNRYLWQLPTLTGWQ